MADGRRARRGQAGLAGQTPRTTSDTRDDDAERRLARAVAYGVPVCGLVATGVVAGVGGLAPAILVLAGTALSGTIGFLWASLRTLSGDAPLPEGVQAHATFARAPAPERKRETLRALKDLELEHSLGKIDDADYLELSTRYRATAKALMREMDEGLAPRRKQAETLVAAYLAKRHVPSSTRSAPAETASPDASPSAPSNEASPRVTCPKCAVSNEPDAAFCKKCGAPLSTLAAGTPEDLDASV